MKTNGFSLIEIMIVVAIIAILAAIVFSAYQNHVARAQVTAALADITNGKGPFEIIVNDGAADAITRDSLRLPATTTRCDISVVGGESGSISCALKGNPTVAGKSISLVRATSGHWHCEITGGLPAGIAPKGCSAL